MSLGSMIRQARTDAALSIDDLAEKTSIRPTLLREIENDNFRNCGGETYARGHIRNIAAKVNLNPKVLLEIFDQEHSVAKRPIYDMLAENSATYQTELRKSLSWRKHITISISAIVIVGITQVTISNLSSKSDGKPTVVITKEPSASTSGSPTSSPSSDPSIPAPTNTYSSGTGVSVDVTAMGGASWLFVSDSSGTTLYSGQVRDGRTLYFRASDAINMKVGNAGVLEIVVNGNPVEPLGAQGEVVSVSYDANS